MEKYCAQRKIDPYNANDTQALAWLNELFQTGAQYGTLNNYRAVIGLLCGELVS